ncbi:MAG: CPBP family intramembrane metalloprotease, partial [Thermoanaerobaculia bacterium]|nr:CPBP family intramembrane metalloprotease [Thermoanaerobaculia bacterium]
MKKLLRQSLRDELERQQDPDHRGGSAGGMPSLYKTAWGLYLVLAIVGVVWLGSQHGALPLEVFLVPSELGEDVVWGLGAGAALLAIWWLASKMVPGLRRLEDEFSTMLAGLDPSEALALALISGFAEELFFRGAMQQSWGFWPTVILFGLLHTGPSRIFLWWTVFATGAGAFFGWIVLERGTLLPAVIAHVLVNGVNLWRLARREVDEI